MGTRVFTYVLPALKCLGKLTHTWKALPSYGLFIHFVMDCFAWHIMGIDVAETNESQAIIGVIDRARRVYSLPNHLCGPNLGQTTHEIRKEWRKWTYHDPAREHLIARYVQLSI